VSNIIDAAQSGDRREALEALRDLLADAMASPEHVAGCPCECGHQPPASELSKNSAQFRAVLLELEKLPKAEGAEPLDQIAANVIQFAPHAARRQSGPAAS